MKFFFQKSKKSIGSFGEVEKQIEEIQTRIDELSHSLEELSSQMKKAISRIAVIRFNPFREVGGDQSFTISFLDEENNGVVVTSHYLHDSTRVYAKSIKNGTSEYSLSEEEKQAIEKAHSSKPETKNSRSVAV